MLTAGSGQDGATEAYRTTFHRTHLRILASWAVVVALPFVSWALTGRSEAIRHWRIPEGVAYMTVCAAVLIHHLWAWRCPRCGAHQGPWIFAARCANCGLTAHDGD